MGQQAPIGSFDMLDYVIRSCATLGELFESFIRYQRLMHTAAGFRLEVREGTSRLTQYLLGDVTPMS